LTYNLAFFLAQRRKRDIEEFRRRPKWNPQDTELKIAKSKSSRAQEKEDALQKLHDDLDKAIAQATAFAEGCSDVILGNGNVPLKKRRCMSSSFSTELLTNYLQDVPQRHYFQTLLEGGTSSQRCGTILKAAFWSQPLIRQHQRPSGCAALEETR